MELKQSSTSESQKTPGGISKNLLTPCRRVGLSRNWKNKGRSPFISPLCGSSKTADHIEDPLPRAKEPRKRKQCTDEKQDKFESNTSTVSMGKKLLQNEVQKDDILEEELLKQCDEIIGTPSRNVELPRKKKSKLLSNIDIEQTSSNIIKNIDSSVSCTQENIIINSTEDYLHGTNRIINLAEKNLIVKPMKNLSSLDSINYLSSNKIAPNSSNNEISCNIQTSADNNTESKHSENMSETLLKDISVPVRKLSTRKSRSFKSPIKPLTVISESNKDRDINNSTKDNIIISETPNISKPKKKITNKHDNSKRKSPNNLSKECVVVIQKKIFKSDFDIYNKTNENTASQVLFDSDTDDTPLCELNKKDYNKLSPDNDISDLIEDTTTEICTNVSASTSENNATNNVFETCSSVNNVKENFQPTKVLKIYHKKTSSRKLSDKKNNKPSLDLKVETLKESGKASSKDSNFDDDDDDFAFETKKTILLRKTYDKTSKLSRAKSTGSITQKDIDELKAKIEMKKKILLAKAMSKDTEELRALIRKWQIGCQNALIELMELMKCKFPEKQNMDYSEMLEMLRIPPSLVGYDSDNDCFNLPNDADFILSKYN